MKSGLANRSVIISGAATGIGKATALAFSKEGANVALIDIDEESLTSTLEQCRAVGDGTPYAIVGDLSTGDGVSNAMGAAIDRLAGTVDVLVNNVGAGSVRSFDEITDEDWLATINLNFLSYVRACRSVLPTMRAAARGVIINNASDLARQPEPNPLDYAASKAAVLALTTGLARAEGPGIRINAVAPGPIWTPFWTKPGGFADTLAAAHDMDPEQAVEHEMSLRSLPLGRLGTPEEVASVIVFMASDLASFVTSSVWGVDGGSIRSIL